MGLDRKAFFLLLLTCTQVENKQQKSYWLVVIRHTWLTSQGTQEDAARKFKNLGRPLCFLDFWVSVYPVVSLKDLTAPNFKC